ncbi:MAG: hypothetical protein IPL46_19270 [Saprospiraceae bacterium]|nr:hypothetical protein [Saprospiraceae bacterium]
MTEVCLPDDIRFTTQSEVDSFPIRFPNCTEIWGSVLITGEIENLDSLRQITFIRLDLRIQEIEVGSLKGLENLTSVGGDLWIWRNKSPSLVNLFGLNGLHYVAGNFYLFSNDAITDCTGLENLDSTGGELSVSGNPSLNSLQGLEGLISVGGDLSLGGTSLTSIMELSSLTIIGGSYSPGLNLNNLSGLKNLTTIKGDFSLENNSNLKELTGSYILFHCFQFSLTFLISFRCDIIFG